MDFTTRMRVVFFPKIFVVLSKGNESGISLLTSLSSKKRKCPKCQIVPLIHPVGDIREGTMLRGGGGSKISELSQTEKLLYSPLE